MSGPPPTTLAYRLMRKSSNAWLFPNKLGHGRFPKEGQYGLRGQVDCQVQEPPVCPESAVATCSPLHVASTKRDSERFCAEWLPPYRWRILLVTCSPERGSIQAGMIQEAKPAPRWVVPGEVALTVLRVLPTAHTGAEVLDSNEGLSGLRTLREAGTETETPGLGTVPCL